MLRRARASMGNRGDGDSFDDSDKLDSEEALKAKSVRARSAMISVVDEELRVALGELLAPLASEADDGAPSEALQKSVLLAVDRIGRCVNQASQDFTTATADAGRAALRAAQKSYEKKVDQNRRATNLVVANRERELEGVFKQSLQSKIEQLADGGGGMLTDALKKFDALQEEHETVKQKVRARAGSDARAIDPRAHARARE